MNFTGEELDDEARREVEEETTPSWDPSHGTELDTGEHEPGGDALPDSDYRGMVADNMAGQAHEELLTPRASQDPAMPFTPKQDAPRETPISSPAPQQQSPGFDWSRAFWAAGGGDLGSFDSERDRARNAPMLAQKAEMERQLGQEKLNAFSLQRQKARDAIDPGSKDSLSAQAEFADLMNGRAAQLRDKHPALAAEFEAYAKKAPTMHAVAIDRAMKNPRMAEVLRQIDSESRNDLAGANLGVKREALGATVADRNADNARQWAQLNEQQRHNKEVEAATGNRVTAKIEKDQEKLNEKVSGLNEQEELLRDAQEQKKKVNTGWLANKFQQGLKYIGLADKDFMDLESTIAGVNNQIIKLQAGGNVTAGEAARMKQQLADLSMDDQEFDTKLARVINQISLKKKNTAKQYERKAGGEVRDQAPIGHELVDKQEQKNAKPPPPAAGTAPGLIRRNKITGAQWKWDGADWQAL